MHRARLAEWIGGLYGQRRRIGQAFHWGAGVLLGLGLVAPGAHAAVPAEIEAAVVRSLGLYSTVPGRRDADETLTLDRGRLEIRFLESASGGRRDAALCNGLRWLLVGRLAGGTGAKGVFEAAAEVEEVALVFYALETRVEPDREGRYVQQRTSVPRARFTIRRETAARLDPAVLKTTLVGARCVSLGRGLVDELWQADGRSNP